MLNLLRLVLPSRARLTFFILLFLGILSGLSNFLFINYVTKIIGLIHSGAYTQPSKKYIIIFLLIIVLIVGLRKILSLMIIKLSQTIFWQLRKKILSTALKANYQQMTAKRVMIQSSLLGDVYILTDAAMSIIGFSTSVILALSCFIYLASLSLILFSVTLVATLLGTTLYYFNSIRYKHLFEKSRKEEHKFVANLLVILDGFKEIFMEPRKGKYVYDEKVEPISQQAYKYTSTAQVGFLNNQITGQVLFYLLVTSILLVLSVTIHVAFNDTVAFVFALFYLLGAIETIMILLPDIVKARVSASQLMILKEELERSDFDNQLPSRYLAKSEFEQITVSDLEFYYGDRNDSFGIGPINFEVGKGEVVFIYGENGSGKTTFVQSLLGLIIASKGEIRFNNQLVDKNTYADYRTLFSVVFSDFYLFTELWGIASLNEGKWNYYLHLFELEGKVKLEGSLYSTTDLSTGQRKRLALIAALLEEKPIIVIDEWAADQDPYFRKKFYTEIIPLLRADGFTIIAITHDDKYYHCADKLYKMNFGKLQAKADLPLSSIHNLTTTKLS